MLDMLKEFGLFLKWVTLWLTAIFLVALFVDLIVEIRWIVKECC